MSSEDESSLIDEPNYAEQISDGDGESQEELDEEEADQIPKPKILDLDSVIQQLNAASPGHNSKGLVMRKFLTCVIQVLNDVDTDMWRDAFSHEGRTKIGFGKINEMYWPGNPADYSRDKEFLEWRNKYFPQDSLSKARSRISDRIITGKYFETQALKEVMAAFMVKLAQAKHGWIRGQEKVGGAIRFLAERTLSANENFWKKKHLLVPDSLAVIIGLLGEKDAEIAKDDDDENDNELEEEDENDFDADTPSNLQKNLADVSRRENELVTRLQQLDTQIKTAHSDLQTANQDIEKLKEKLRRLESKYSVFSRARKVFGPEKAEFAISSIMDNIQEAQNSRKQWGDVAENVESLLSQEGSTCKQAEDCMEVDNEDNVVGGNEGDENLSTNGEGKSSNDKKLDSETPETDGDSGEDERAEKVGVGEEDENAEKVGVDEDDDNADDDNKQGNEESSENELDDVADPDEEDRGEDEKSEDDEQRVENEKPENQVFEFA